MKIYCALALTLLSSYLNAAVEVSVKNNADEVLELLSVDTQVSTFSSSLSSTINPSQTNRFDVVSSFPGVVEIVDLEYGFGPTSGARCHFRYVTVRNNQGNMLPQPIIAEDQGSGYKDRARCSGRILAFDLRTGKAVVEFSADRKTSY